MKSLFPQIKTEQIVLHIPHSSTLIPEEYKALLYLDDDQLKEELLKMTDLYTDELFDCPGVPESNKVVFPYSRLICDVERFRDDSLEKMADRGMGICYRMTSGLEPLKSVTAEHEKEMLGLYDSYHEQLNAVVERVLNECGTVLVVDCHSFSSERLPYEKSEADSRPDICIGTDPDFHTPSWVIEYMVRAFICKGYSVMLDDPFEGTMVPGNYYHQESRILAVMIEVNRKLYMDESSGKRREDFAQVKADICDVISHIKVNPDVIAARDMAVKNFCKNSHWRRFYEESPSLVCRLWVEKSFVFSSGNVSDDFIIHWKQLEDMMTIEDWKHLWKFSGNNPSRVKYRNKVKELQERQGG